MSSSSRHIRLERWLTHLVWMLPLATAAITYPLATAHFAGEAENRKPQRVVAREERQVRSGDPETLIKAAIEDSKAREKEIEAEKKESFANLDAAALKQRLLKLLAKSKQMDPSDDFFENTETYHKLTRELIHKEGIAGMQWLDERHLWGLCSDVVGELAKSDPDGALNYVIHSNHGYPPCTGSDLMELLNAQASKGGDALTAAVAQVPWERFERHNYLPPNDYYGDQAALCLPLDPALAKVWLESGAARSMAEQGVELSNTLFACFSRDPAQALEQWSTWPRFRQGQAETDLMSMLSWNPSDDERNSTTAAILSAPPGIAVQLQESLSKIAGDTSRPADEIRHAYPGLFPEKPPAAEGP